MKFLPRLQDLLQRRSNVYGVNRRNVELIYRHNPRRHYPLADDKLIAKQHLRAGGVAVLDNLAVCGNLGEVAQFLDQLGQHEQFVIKPARSSGGRGLLVLGERSADGWQSAGGDTVSRSALGYHCANIVYGVYSKDRPDRAFAEPRVVPHRVYAQLWSRGLCDIRVLTLHGQPFMAMVRVPTLRSAGKANLHQGGLGLAVDLDTGVTLEAVQKGRSIERHPESDAPLVGIELPCWAEVIDVARRAARSVPLGYLGIDLVVDEHEKCWVLEINVRPGLEIQNVNGRALGRALERVA